MNDFAILFANAILRGAQAYQNEVSRRQMPGVFR